MHELLAPIREQFKTFEQSVQESKTQSEVNKQELKSAFESNLRLFQQQQQAAVEAFQRQTERIGDEANQLAKALEFIFGVGSLLPKFEEYIKGKEVGDSFEFTLSPEEG